MDFYREGFLNKAGKGLIQTHLHSWRPRYFVLNGFTLKYYKCKEVLPENMLGSIEVSEMESVSVLKNEKHAFQITTNSPKPRTYYMSGRNDEEIQGWIKCLIMAKTKYEEKLKEKSKSEDVPVKSVYCDITIPPEKPQRSQVASVPGCSAETSSETPSDSQPVSNDYDLPNERPKASRKTVQKMEEGVCHDPTYDSIDESAVATKKIENSDQDEDSDLYDTVTVTTKKSKSTRMSDPFPLASAPPPLPARQPSMDAPPVCKKIPQGSKEPAREVVGLYDEVGPATQTVTTEIEKKEIKNEPPAEPPHEASHLYSKPQKAMKKKMSKRKLIPGLMDVGEVDIKIEQDAAAGDEILQEGMTKPMGDRFAIEDLRDAVAEFDEELNNNSGEAVLADFDVDQNDSAFEVLKMFLVKYQ